MSLTHLPRPNPRALTPSFSLARTQRPKQPRPVELGRRALAFASWLVIEARPPILGVFALRMVVATRLVNNPTPGRIVLTVAWLLVTMAVYVFNGTSDIVGDRLNGSRRPLAIGQLSIRSAWIACAVLAATALGLAWWCGDGPGVCASASLGLGWCYSAGPTLKRSSIGFAVTIFGGAALTYVSGCDQAHAPWGVWIALVAFAGWIGLCSGAKDLSDISGDRADGRRTWPVMIGPSRTGRLLTLFATCAAAITASVAAVDAPRLIPAAAVLAVGTGCYVWRLARVTETDSRDRLRRPYRAFMMTQYAVNLAVLLCLL